MKGSKTGVNVPSMKVYDSDRAIESPGRRSDVSVKNGGLHTGSRRGLYAGSTPDTGAAIGSHKPESPGV